MEMNDKQDRISFYIFSADKSDFIFENGINIAFALAGDNTLLVSGKNYDLHQGGIYVVNRFELFYCRCEKAGKVILLQIPYDFLHLAGVENTFFDCYSADDSGGANHRYDQIRTLLSHVFQEYFREQDHRTSSTQYVIRLLNDLQENFTDRSRKQELPVQTEGMLRIERLLAYIHEHWNEDLKVSTLAAQEYLSPNYLSRLVKKTLHCTLTEYITRLRVLHAQTELQRTEHSITHISYACGFKNTASFIHYFREVHGMTPNEYRKLHSSKTNRLDSERIPEIDMSYLLQFADMGENEPKAVPTAERYGIRISAATAGRPVRHSWKTLLNVGYAHDILFGLVQEQIRQAQREIGFQYLRFHGILDDDMQVYSEDADGKAVYNFVNVDLVLDFVLSAGLKPYLELGYVPGRLAKEHKTPFLRRSYYTAPRDLLKWQLLLQNVLAHLLERYGAEEMRNWRFEAISFSLVMSDWITFADYCDLYEVTYRAVKNAGIAFQFGGPAIFASEVMEADDLQRFLSYVKEQNCIPDYFTAKNYPYLSIQRDIDFQKFSLSQASSPSVLSRDEDFTEHFLQEMRKILHSAGMGNKEIWMVEWSSTIWQRDLAADTCYKAAWIARTICRNYDQADAFGYWLLTDYMEEHPIRGCFFGGPGLFTYHGIPKAGWQAYRLLNHLGSRVLDAGEGYFITAGVDSIQLLFYNYAQYDNLYRYRYRILQNPNDAYRVFTDKPDSTFSVILRDLPEGRWRLERYAAGRENGSAFDMWLHMGAPETLTQEQLQRLKASAENFQCSQKTISINGEFELTASLQAHEIELVILKKEE